MLYHAHPRMNNLFLLTLVELLRKCPVKIQNSSSKEILEANTKRTLRIKAMFDSF
jgi:hypothetical protein